MTDKACIDHLAVTAPTLEAGVAYVRDVLGVEPGPGGEHERMGTHNRLLRLGEALYLEVIAPNPAMPAPGRARWFGLDDLAADAPPRLGAWVLRTDDIDAATAAATEALGVVEPMSRGAFEWRITIPADGRQPLGGVAPALIEWRAGGHPAERLPDGGLALEGLDIFHPEPRRVERLLASIGFTGPVAVHALPAGRMPHLAASIATPSGRRRLSGAAAG